MSAQAKNEKGLLSNWFTGKFWDSKITSANVRKNERLLGYIIGPFGIMLLQSIVSSYFNQYLTDVMGFTVSKGAWVASFMVMFPLFSKVLDAITNLIMAKMLDSTTCKQGKLRPWFILSLPIVVLSIILLFAVPDMEPHAQAIWIVVAYNLFYSVGYTMWYMSYQLIAPLSTRNIKQRSGNSMAGQITKNIGTGLISILFPTILTIILRLSGQNNKQGYLIAIAIICCIAVPFTFIQYFFTRERVTEERRNKFVNDIEESVSVKEASFTQQLKAGLKNKYWIMLIVMLLVYEVFNALRTISQVYYSAWIVQGNAYGDFAAVQAKFVMIALAPMGPGIILLLPLVRKYGRRAMIIAGSVLAMIGSAGAYVMAGNSIGVYAGTAIAGLGAIAFIYTLTTFIGDCIDHVEYQQGIRVEGVTAAIVGFVHCFSNGIGHAIFNGGLMLSGYTTPQQIGETVKGVALYADQSVTASTWINFSYQGSLFLKGILFFILFIFFFDIEKIMDKVHDALQQRKKDECEKLGIVYIPSHEAERLERQKQKEEAEENRIKELKQYCLNKRLDFDKENQKYLDKQAKKELKKKKRKKKVKTFAGSEAKGRD